MATQADGGDDRMSRPRIAGQTQPQLRQRTAVSSPDEPRTTPITRPTGPPAGPGGTAPGAAGSGPKGLGLTSVAGRKKKRLGRQGLLRTLCLRPAGVLGRCIALLLPLVILGLGLVYAKLRSGPISARFLANPIEQALNAELGGFKVAIGDAELRLSERGWLELRLKSVRLTDEADNLVALAASAGVEISGRALRRGRIAPSRVDLIEPRFLLTTDEAGALSVRPSAEPTARPDVRGAASERRADGEPAASPKPGPQPAARAGQDESAAMINVAGALSQALSRMREDDATAFFLEAFGLRHATVILDREGNKVVWKVPELNLDLSHKQQKSVLIANARVDTGGEPWSLSLRATEGAQDHSVRLEATFDSLVPHMAVRGFGWLHALSGFNAPVAGKALIDLGPRGDVRYGRLEMTAGAGQIMLDGFALAVERGALQAALKGPGQLEITLAELQSGDNRIRLKGTMARQAPAASWTFDVSAVDGALAGAEAGSPPVRLERFRSRGSIGTEAGRIELTELTIKAGAAEVVAKGEMGGGASLEGKISPMPLSMLKAVWPEALAPRARAFVRESVAKGQLRGGSFKLATQPGDAAAGNGDARRLSLTLEAADLEIEVRKGLPPIEAPRALLRVEGNSLELTIPEAQVASSGNRKIALRGGRATIVELDAQHPLAEISVRALGPLAALLELAERDPAVPAKGLGIPLAHVEGKADFQIRIAAPLGQETAAQDLRYDIKGRISDAKIKDAVGTHDISGASMTLDASERGADLKGEALLAGVPLRFSSHWMSNGNDSRPPQLKINARLDNADRAQLGLDLDAFLQGEVPFEITVQRGTADDLKVHVYGDLTAAELILDDVHWQKPVGRPARVEFDVAKRRQTRIVELQNFKVAGENIAVDGWVALGPDNKAREYYFPDFSLNVVTNLEVQGTLRADRMWEVRVRGKTFDGRDLFRSFFAFADAAPKPARPDKPGIELAAEIDTVLGASDTTLKHVRFRATKRAQQLVGLDMSASMEGGRQVTALMRPERGRPRTLQIDSTDAGQALKLIGFYPNMVGGKGHLRLNLDTRGAVETAGTLEVKNFRILGDPIIAEVFATPDPSSPPVQGKGRRKVVREQFDFQTLEAAFMVGNGQVVIENSSAHGPLIGASMRGKLDFKAQSMLLGGTYVPLSGLSRPLSQLPGIRELFTGPRGEGLLGITYEIKGSMADPQVLVNPLSMLAPGIIREIFQMAPENSKVTPKSEPARRGQPQIRSSPPTEKGGSRGAARSAEPEVGDGWSTKIEGNPAKRRPPAQPQQQ